jgi:DNA-binding NarL/FixJ family response regulator
MVYLSYPTSLIMSPLKIVICEDHAITTDGLRVLISFQPDFAVVGHARKWEELNALLKENAPDILILDLNLGKEDGFTILQCVKKDFPDIRVLILTMYNDGQLIDKARQLKANGYVLKNASSGELIEALRGVMKPEFYEDPKAYLLRKSEGIQRDSFIEKMRLTNREVEIVKLLAEGNNSEKISEKLFLSLHAVRTHIKNIMKKLGLNSTADLVRFAFKNKLIE